MNKKKMKKYFLQGTAEELEIGDMIELDLTEDLPNGKVRHHHLECKFIPPLIPLLLEQGIIEVQEVKEKETKESQPEDNKPEEDTNVIALNMIKSLAHSNIKMATRLDALEKLVKKLSLTIAHNGVPQSVNKPKPRRNAKKAGRKQED